MAVFETKYYIGDTVWYYDSIQCRIPKEVIIHAIEYREGYGVRYKLLEGKNFYMLECQLYSTELEAYESKREDIKEWREDRLSSVEQEFKKRIDEINEVIYAIKKGEPVN